MSWPADPSAGRLQLIPQHSAAVNGHPAVALSADSNGVRHGSSRVLERREQHRVSVGAGPDDQRRGSASRHAAREQPSFAESYAGHLKVISAAAQPIPTSSKRLRKSREVRQQADLGGQTRSAARVRFKSQTLRACVKKPPGARAALQNCTRSAGSMNPQICYLQAFVIQLRLFKQLIYSHH